MPGISFGVSIHRFHPDAVLACFMMEMTPHATKKIAATHANTRDAVLPNSDTIRFAKSLLTSGSIAAYYHPHTL